MLGMHGTVYANYAIDKSDLLLAFGVSRANIVHIDIDAAEIGKNKQPHMSICGDVKLALEGMNSLIKETGLDKKLDFSPWIEELDRQKKAHPLSYKEFGEEIPPQYAIQLLAELTSGLANGCLLGLGAMGFGLPAAAGAAVGNPAVTVVDIDGDGSLMNVQELAMIHIEKLPVRSCNEAEIYPDLVAIAKGFKVPGARVTKKSELREAIREMMETQVLLTAKTMKAGMQAQLALVSKVRSVQNQWNIESGDGNWARIGFWLRKLVYTYPCPLNVLPSIVELNTSSG
ncbi:hypothetical protein HPP92_000879 [Vanilla planifolia]|uniref:Acetolactate synthase n=1 Tax=Vanilla planifolia TaxID=51239 RepID=A0A835S296_VANPL|nr:hypothetical protein HPP92_000879 [Vanilla planifolia]